MPMPASQTKAYVETRSIELIESIFTAARVVIKVPRYEIKKGGFFSSDYAMYMVESEIVTVGNKNRIRVLRKDSDFYELRRYLRLQYPYLLVPPLPKLNSKLVPKVLLKRQRLF